MKLPLADLRTLMPALGSGAVVPPPVQTTEWKLQLQRAEAAHAGPETPQRLPFAPRRDDDAKDLEPCGAPALNGAPPPPRPEPPTTRPSSAEDPVPAHEAKEREPERAPVRLHVQPVSAEGVKVWLGIDGDAALVAQRASAAVADLRRNLQPTGERIASLVCNGVPVDPRIVFSAPRTRASTFLAKDSP